MCGVLKCFRYIQSVAFTHTRCTHYSINETVGNNFGKRLNLTQQHSPNHGVYHLKNVCMCRGLLVHFDYFSNDYNFPFDCCANVSAFVVGIYRMHIDSTFQRPELADTQMHSFDLYQCNTISVFLHNSNIGI